MFNPSDLLGGLLQSGLRGPSMNRIEHAMGQRGLGAPGGPLGQILGRLGGGGSGGMGYGASGSDSLGGLAEMAGRHFGGGRSLGGRDLAMGGLGALAGAILSGRGRSMGRSSIGGGNLRGAVGAGGLALLGMLAMQALRNAGQQGSGLGQGTGQAWGQGAGSQGAGGRPTALPTGLQANPPAVEPAPPAVDEPPDEAISENTAMLVLKAMINAAKADGQIDATERQRIAGKIQESGTDQEAIAFLQQEMDKPLDLDGLVAEVRDPVVAAQVYAASLLAIKVDTLSERSYLQDLAGRLRLDPATVQQLHQALGAPMP